MATQPTAAPVTFSSPSMRVRANLVRGLQAVDELERAWAARDYWTAREHARTAQEYLELARVAWVEVEATTNQLQELEPLAAAAGAVGAVLVDLTPDQEAPGRCLCDGPWAADEPELRPDPESREHGTDTPGCKWYTGPATPQADAAAGMDQYQADGR